ncbi:MAG: aspartyl protease family protein [Deltaproteobacteria bacterium]|nr:aspartyl protease family protein [Deltaproteobacteria bacterium]
MLEFGISPNALQGAGPIIVTYVGITNAHKAALEAEGKPVPKHVKCRLLIDTGATTTMVAHDIAELAGLKLISTNVPVHGVGVDTSGRAYLGQVLFVSASKKNPDAQHVMSVDTKILSGEFPMARDRIDGLIGRDVLRFFDFRYNGETGVFSMRYLRQN